MCVATFIDFDERTIPDAITIPGSLLAILGSAIFVGWHLPIDLVDEASKAWPIALSYDAPWANHSMVGKSGLWMGLACFSVWCLALLDRRWITRRGLSKAFTYFFARLARSPSTKGICLLWLVGCLAICLMWSWLDVACQQSLLSSLVGLLLGGMTVWLIRCTASLALGVEALGFGDVTLMSMVGAFLGWQPAMIAFFISPFIAVLIFLVRYLATGDNRAAFGPYLCAATLAVILAWDRVWNGYFQDLLSVVGILLFEILFAGLLLMGALLWIWRLIKSSLGWSS
jgi:prepilin signal peptidase PulO-like enzyme (type II secretory pathway)